VRELTADLFVSMDGFASEERTLLSRDPASLRCMCFGAFLPHSAKNVFFSVRLARVSNMRRRKWSASAREPVSRVQLNP